VDVRDKSQRLACLRDSSGDFGEVGTYAAPLPGNRRYAVGLSETIGVKEDGSFIDLEGLASRPRRSAPRVPPGSPAVRSYPT